MMSFDRAGSRTFVAITLAVLALAFPHPAHAQAAYPDRPVRIVLPFAAGGVADITARIVAEKLAIDSSEPLPGSPQMFAEFLQAEHAKWGALIREAGIKLE